MNVNLISNVLDTPEIFWSEPAYEELYQAVRGQEFKGTHVTTGVAVLSMFVSN